MTDFIGGFCANYVFFLNVKKGVKESVFFLKENEEFCRILLKILLLYFRNEILNIN
jgi:hypothetical protein